MSFPDSTNTGYVNAPGYPGSLTPFSGTIQSNTTYSFRSFSGGVNIGASGTPVTGVTLFGCEIDAAGASAPCVLLWGDNITLSYCTIKPTGVSAPPVTHAAGYQYGIEADGGYNTFVDQLTVQYCDIWGFANCIDVTGSTQAKPQVYQYNYIHDARADGGVDHTDGLGCLSGSGSGSYVVINGNTIQSAGNTNGIAFQGGTWSNMTVTGNLFGGFGYTINIDGTTSHVTFTGNTFSTGLLPGFGPLYPSGGNFWRNTGALWYGNRWLVPAGAAWGNPAHSGLFWMPVDSTIPGNDDDSAYVSSVDYMTVTPTYYPGALMACRP